MRSFQRLPYTVLVAIAFAVTSPAASQNLTPRAEPGVPITRAMVTVSGDSADRLRLGVLDGSAALNGYLLRSTSSLMDPQRSGGRAQPLGVVLPLVMEVTNTSLPFGQNDGALWQGKGYNVRALAGLTATFGPVQLVAIPEIVAMTNNRLSIDPTDLRFSRPLPGTRSVWSSPHNVVPYSIDLPYRFGERGIRKVYPGQSSITVSTGAIQIGAATENEWWGPALRNPLMLSDNAPGFPHAFIRTGRPLNTGLGGFEFRWIIGGLKESDYFDSDVTNNVRSVSAAALVWQPYSSSGLNFGVMRSVYSPADGYSGVASHAVDFLKTTGHPNALPITDSTMTPGPDQIFSLFLHWALPRHGLESYIEWGRTEFPSSPHDFLTEPNHTRGYTAGLQWLSAPSGSASRVRLQTEFTNVEQSSTYRLRPIGSWYTSRAVIQGYTNEGQMLGAGIGPGSSSEWFAADYMRHAWSFGLNFGRQRFNNDAFFAQSNPNRCFHDVTVYPGMRAQLNTRLLKVGFEASRVVRYNSFFQRIRGCANGAEAIGDRTSQHMAITITALQW
ncbi:MAG TPA: hypothetical protein VM053_03570 [Gemmatimonadaceae bacterium]|nr:hypothetical protein [Gemmatimonadaceae bacterium]